MTSKPDKILVVDDEVPNCELMVRRLLRKGFEAYPALDGDSALDWIENNPVDTVLLDIDMPGMSGMKLLQILREKFDLAQLPIIMVTGKTSSEDVVKALNMGANDYITKPIDFAILLARVQTQLSRKHAEQALRISEERYALAALGSNDGLWDWNFITNKIHYSLRWKTMLGYEEQEIADTPDEWLKRIHPDDIARVRSDIAAHLKKLTPHFEGEYRLKHKDGNYHWMLGRGISVHGENGNPFRMAGSQTDITRGKVVDVLTGLPNRVLFMDRLTRSFERTKRRDNKSFALIFLDLDSFKLINDSMGHLVGDQVLVMIASRLDSTVRSYDTISRHGRNHTIARLGGDEFTILLEDITSTRDAVRVVERIMSRLSEPFVINNQELFLTASIGIAQYNSSYNTPEEILRDSDTAMYSAKSLGKGRYEIFDSTMRANTVARLQLESDLRRAIERKEFQVYYQAIVDLLTERILGFEALIRWNHSKKGMIPPNEFIPVAEETGMTVEIGQWVLETVCQQARIWQTRFPSENPLSVNINISASHFLQSDLVQFCRKILDETQLSCSSLTLEVTESAMMPDPEAAINLMHQLKSLGIKLAMDDFGTGYSSLSYLHQFPLDSLKIDRSFVSRMMEDDEIVRTIITMGKNLGLKVIAEGVEKAEQAEKLLQLGCRYAQGFHFSVPVDASAATDLIMEKQYLLMSTTPDASSESFSLLND